MLDFRISTFLSVCKYMNFTKAAKENHITQPAVSQQIHSLEEELGARLFNYKHKKLELTEAGTALRTACITFSNDFNKLMRNIGSDTAALPDIRLGATLTIGEYVLPDMITDFAEKHPDHKISLLIQDTAIILKALDEDRIDFAFIEGYFPKSEYDYIIWKRQELIPVCSPSHPLLSVSALTAEHLLDYPLILREKGSGTRETLENFLSCENISIKDFKHTLEIGGIEAIKKIVSACNGVTFLYEPAVAREIKENILFPIRLNHNFDNAFTFIWRKGSLYSNRYKAFFREFSGSQQDIITS